MPLDPRLILGAGQGGTPVDPLAFQRGQAQAFQLQQAQQQTQAGALQLADAQRQEQERRDLGAIYRRHVVTDPQTGQATLDLPGAMTEAYRVNPVTAFTMQQEYTTTQAESRKTALEAQKQQTEQALKGLEFGGQVAQGVEDRIAAGADPQDAWQWGLETMRRAGMATESITPTYDATMLAGWKGQATAIKDKLEAQQKAIDQQLREQEIVTQRRGQEITMRGQDLTAQTQQRGQDITVRGQDIEAQGQQRTAQQRVGEREKDLRTEFNALTKDYRTVSDAYGRIQSAQETGPGDISLIFSYMKLLDPASTVREGEFATAQNAGGVPERIIAQYNRLVSGERLAPETRKQFLDQAQGLYDQSTRDYQRSKTHYEGLATRYGVDPANVTQEFGSTATRPRGGTAARPAEAPRRYTRQQVEQKLKPGWTLDQAIEYYRSQGIEVD